MTQLSNSKKIFFLLQIALIFLLSGCGATDSTLEPSTSNSSSPTASQEPSQPDAPMIEPASISDENAFITFKADYTKIKTYSNTLIASHINHQIEKQLITYKNDATLTASLDVANQPSKEEPHSPVDVTIKSALAYGDPYIFTYIFEDTSGDNATQDKVYFNFDLRTGQEIKLFDLVTEDAVQTTFEELTASQYGEDALDFSIGTWNLDHAYRFFDRQHIGIYAPAYQLSENQAEPLLAMMTIPEYVSPETAKPIGTSIDYANKCEYNNGYKLCYTYPVLEGSSPIINTINKTIKTDIESSMNYNIDLAIDDHAAQANSDYPWRPYMFTADYEVFENTENTLSLITKYYQYTGGAHGLGYTVAYNYDLKTGKELALSDLFEPGFDYITYINDHIYSQMALLEQEKSVLWDTAYNFNGIREDQDFYIKDGALQIYFGVYEIAPYSGGEPTFEIPLNYPL